MKVKDRQLLDRSTREDRLYLRESSPIKISITDLADRGLLDGSPSIQNNGSLKSRKALDLKSREARIRERTQPYQKHLKLATLAHMLRVYSQRGISFVKFCSEKDAENSNEILLNELEHIIIHQLGLPFINEDLHEILSIFLKNDSKYVNYESLISYSGLSTDKSERIASDKNSGQLHLEIISNLFPDMKRCLLNLYHKKKTTYQDIFHQFSKYDKNNSGSIAANQFVRILGECYVELNDFEEDLVVELLDVSGTGRIVFDILLKYCFFEVVSKEINRELSPNRKILQEISVEPRRASVSLIQNNNLGVSPEKDISVYSLSKRPQTANTFMKNRSKHNSEERSCNSNSKSSVVKHISEGSSYSEHPIFNEDTTEQCNIDQQTIIINPTKRLPFHQTTDDHIILIARDFLSKIGDILRRCINAGQSFNYIFKYFDRQDLGFFGVKELIYACSELKIELSERVATTMVYQIASSTQHFIESDEGEKYTYFEDTDEGDKVFHSHQAIITFSSFYVYFIDPNFYFEVESSILEQLTSKLKEELNLYSQRKTSSNTSVFLQNLLKLFSLEGFDLLDLYNGKYDSLMTSENFRNSLITLDLVWVSQSDIDRFIMRYNIDGKGNCSASQFIRMVISSNPLWMNVIYKLRSNSKLSIEENQDLEIRQAEHSIEPLSKLPLLSKQDSFKKISEPQLLLTQHPISAEQFDFDNSIADLYGFEYDEFNSIANMLNINVDAEPFLSWIVVDAVLSALPIHWKRQYENGNIIYVNKINNKKQLEHPLCDDFKKLAEKYRKLHRIYGKHRVIESKPNLDLKKYPKMISDLKIANPKRHVISQRNKGRSKESTSANTDTKLPKIK